VVGSSVTLRKNCDRIQARAIRRCGELLQKIKAQQGKRTDLEPGRDGSPKSPTRTSAARDAGLSVDQRKTALRVDLPESEPPWYVSSRNPGGEKCRKPWCGSNSRTFA
jgi:hypothetical protein